MGLLGLAVVALLLALPAVAPAKITPPNVIVIMTDDQTYDDLEAMPRTRSLIGAPGTTFTRAYVSYPLCCPSRATFLTGQYAHNTGVRSTVPPHGGVEALKADHTLPVWLHDAGYDTVHIGKYLNGYGWRRPPDVPPGWSDWHALMDRSTYQMWGYTLFDNGFPNRFGHFEVEDPATYQTDVLRDRAVEAITAHAVLPRPFFMSLNFVAPHGEVFAPGGSTIPGIRPAPRHRGSFAGEVPNALSYDEADVSDKPPWVRALPALTPRMQRRIARDYRDRRASLLAVDEAVERIVDQLRVTGQLDRTYIVFTSDNGFFQGEHRIPKGKYLAYDPATHVPLLIRGPGIRAGVVTDALTPNTDLAPTILEITGARGDLEMDGRSLLLSTRGRVMRTGRPILHEGLVAGDADRDGEPTGRTMGEYAAIRTNRYLFVLWQDGGRELYDLERDPDQLESRHLDPRYAQVRAQLTAELRRLQTCAGATCLAPVDDPSPLRRRR